MAQVFGKFVWLSNQIQKGLPSCRRRFKQLAIFAYDWSIFVYLLIRRSSVLRAEWMEYTNPGPISHHSRLFIVTWPRQETGSIDVDPT